MTRSDYKPGKAKLGDPLTPRELEILSLVAQGRSTPTISMQLGIAQNTIKTHLASVYRKTGSGNRVQAARHYLERYEDRSRGG